MDTQTVPSELSLVRTELSNTRTLLAHTKAAIGLVISALAFMKLFDSYLIFDICGWTFIGLAVFVMVRGFISYRKTLSTIECYKDALKSDSA